ncbi:MAG TPA: hypothetical protein VIH14_06670 [Anaerolineales bacterium]
MSGPTKTVDIAPQTYGRAAGSWPVWAIINRTELILSMEEIQQAPLREHGYPYKVLWIIIKTYTDKVGLHGWNFEKNKPLWFQLGGEEPTTTPVLDPLTPGAYSIPDYVDFPSYVIIPGMGCYIIEAVWDAGSWQIYLTVK